MGNTTEPCECVLCCLSRQRDEQMIRASERDALHNAARAELLAEAAGCINSLLALARQHISNADHFLAVVAGEEWLDRYAALEADHGKD